jgi:hypothetical protein
MLDFPLRPAILTLFDPGAKKMIQRSAMAAGALVAFAMSVLTAQAHDDSKYPNWSGQWFRLPNPDPPRYDPSKPIRGQEAPLTEEYRLRHEASMKDQDNGGFGLDMNYSCMAQTMPRLMNGIVPAEYVILPDVTRILFERMNYQARRIYTDGRAWPKEIEPTSAGYSIGTWLDTDGDGRLDTLEVETRGIRWPKTWDQTGMPMADDSETVVKERITLDKTNPNVLHNQMTTIDNSLTRPWVATTSYRRNATVKWGEDSCLVNPYVTIDKQVYMLSGDNKLMPMKPDQAAPDLTFFKPAKGK